MEETIKQLIRDSIEKRLEGFDDIDNLLPNHTLIDRWITDIMTIGFNNGDIEAAAQDIFEMQSVFNPDVSIEDLRARLTLSSSRFTDEILAFQTYVEMRDDSPEEKIIKAVKKDLKPVEPGEFMLS